MCPSTDLAELQHRFADDVLQKLLRHIEVENQKHVDGQRPGGYVYRVSHAWTDGPFMYVVYRAEPLEITWGLVRDTRESLIDAGPWNDTDSPALMYFLLDFEEGWGGPLTPEAGKDPEVIRWRGDQQDSLPQLVVGLSESHHYVSTPGGAVTADDVAPAAEPRRYGNSL